MACRSAGLIAALAGPSSSGADHRVGLTEVRKLSEELAEIEEHYELVRDYSSFVAFMLDCLALIEASLPEVSITALATAKKFFCGQATEEELEQARVKCWNHLEAHGYGSEIEAPEAIAIRASICALYSKPSTDDAVELLEWFLSLVNRLGDRSAEERALLREHFPVGRSSEASEQL